MEVSKTKYGTDVEKGIIREYIKRKKNEVYKLLPLREEDGFWREHLHTLKVEFDGCYNLFNGSVATLEICCKMEALKDLDDFLKYRKTIFEILSCLDRIEGEFSE